MKNRTIKILSAVTAVISVAVSLCGCGVKKNEYTSFAMGNVLGAVLYSGDKEKSDKVWNDITSAVNSADKSLSATIEGSDISRINMTGTAKVDDYTLSFLEKAVLLCNTLDGRLDITIGAVTELWGFTGGEPSVPSKDALEAALKTVGSDGVFIDEANKTVSLEKGQKLDAGALGKGEACDIIKEKLSAENISACVSFGGNVLVCGKNPNGKNGLWKIGIRDPLGSADDIFASVLLDASTGAKCVSTSGSYEKFFEKDGKKYHHIIDPSTGFPVENGLLAVSVVCSSGLNADALSTALFVNGCNGTAMRWLKAFGADAVFVFSDGTVRITEGLSQNFTILKNDSYKVSVYNEESK